MKILFVGDNSQETTALTDELTKGIPAIQIHLSPNALSALAQLQRSGAFDVVVLDSSVPRDDLVAVTTAVKKEKKPVGVIALLAAMVKEVPKELANAGVNRFIPKHPGYGALLSEVLQQIKEPRRAEPASNTRSIRLLYLGNTETIKRHLSGMPCFLLEPIFLTSDGILQLPESGALPGDLVIIDHAVFRAETSKTLKDVLPTISDLPVIVLVEPGDDETSIQAIRAGAADCVAKTESFFQRLLPIIEREIRIRELAREKESLKARGTRLRQIVENMPVGVSQIAQDGTFLAINQTGLQLMGATRIEQVIGKNLLHLAPREEREKIEAFIASIKNWVRASISLSWKGLDGSTSGIELRGIPMRRDPGGPACALTTLQPLSTQAGGTIADEDIKKRCEDLTKALLSYENKHKELQEKNRLNQEEWEEAVRQAESRCLAAEEQQAKLKELAEETASRMKLLADEYSAERTAWEQSHQSFIEQCTKIEAVAESLRATQIGLVENHRVEQAQWSLQRQELEQKLASAEENLSRISTELSSERSQSSLSLKELQQKYEAAEEQRASLEANLHEAGSKITEQAETHNAERLQQELAQRELENRFRTAEELRANLEAALGEAEARIAQQAEEHRAEQAQQELSRKDFEQKSLNAETQRNSMESALHEAEALLSRQAQTHATERDQNDLARLKWEQQCRSAEEQLAAMQETLEQAESLIALRAEEQAAERNQWDQIRLVLEQELLSAEGERDAFSEALQTADSGLIEQSGNLAAERSRRDAVQFELEHRCQIAEEQQAALQTALQHEKAQQELVQREWEQKHQAVECKHTQMETLLHDMEDRLLQMTEKYQAGQTQQQSMLHELELKCQASEALRTSLVSALQDAEAKIAELTGHHNVERDQLELAHRELDAKYQSLETQSAAFHAALQEAESRLADLTEKHSAELAQQELARKELELKCQDSDTQRATLVSALQDAETKIAELTGHHSVERDQLELAHRELDAKYQSLETQSAAFHAAMQEAESRFADLTEKHSAELAQQELTRKELELKCQDSDIQRATLVSALQDAEAKIAELTGHHSVERDRLELAHRELDAKYQSLETQSAAFHAAMQGAESRFADLTEKHSAELAQQGLARKELEFKFQAVDKQRAALQIALTSAEASFVRQIEKHRAEVSQFEFGQKKSEQKYQTAEKQRAALQTELRETELKLAELKEKHATEHAQGGLARTEWERRFKDAESEHAAALQNLVRETESRLAWISDQNQAKALQLESMQKELGQLQADYRNLTTESTDIRLRYQRLSQFASAGIVLAAKDGVVLQCNDTAAQIFGYSNAGEALAQTTENQFRIYAFEGALDVRLHQDGKLENIEWTSLGRDGNLIRIQESVSLIENPAGGEPIVERILTDISKTHKLSEEIRRMRRMESAGDLATATIKSFRDLCDSLAQSSKQLISAADDSNAVRLQAEALYDEANRGVKHARQFLSVAQKADRAPSFLNLNEIFVSNDTLLHSLIGEDIDLMTTLSPHIGMISADRNEVIQLVGSLLANAREALPLGGSITIETSNVEVDSPASGYPAELHSGIYVRMLFSTDGCAVQPERRNASIRMIVDRMGGFLVTTNDSKLGNTHKIYLPRVEAVAGQASLLASTISA